MDNNSFTKEAEILFKKTQAFNTIKNPASPKKITIHSLLDAILSDGEWFSLFLTFFDPGIQEKMKEAYIQREVVAATDYILHPLTKKQIGIDCRDLLGIENCPIDLYDLICWVALQENVIKNRFGPEYISHCSITQKSSIKECRNDASSQPGEVLNKSQTLPASRCNNDFEKIIQTMKNVRDYFKKEIAGQETVIHSIITGLAHADMKRVIDPKNVRPLAVFIFMGPSGVGKIQSAVCLAEALQVPYKIYDITQCYDEDLYSELTGDKKPGLLTGFVAANDRSLLIVDGIEKAGKNIIQIFLQILEHGTAYDRNLNEEISFKNTILIFTTNAGVILYRDPYHEIFTLKPEAQRPTLLSVLENEINPVTNENVFPRGICSRLDQGHLVLFNHIPIPDKIRIMKKELDKNIALFRDTYGITITYDSLLPITLLYHCGANSDLILIKNLTEKIIWSELFHYTYALKDESSVTSFFKTITEIVIIPEIFQEQTLGRLPDDEIQKLFRVPSDIIILLIIDNDYQDNFVKIQSFEYNDITYSIQWICISDIELLKQKLQANNLPTFIFIDIWICGKDSRLFPEMEGRPKIADLTEGHIPYALNELILGQTILKYIRGHFWDIPVYILSFTGKQTPNKIHPRIDDELLLDYIRIFGVKGRVELQQNRPEKDNSFRNEIVRINKDAFFEKTAKSLSKKREIVLFDRIPIEYRNQKRCNIKLRNFSKTRCLDATDFCDIISDVELPTTRFDDVIGADNAKIPLKKLIMWLENTDFYRTNLIRPPRGILLTGLPGTGKTMLARALAGEANAAFMVRSGTSFISRWVGSGPENIRELFVRARKYAPTIVFIDEIDSFAGKRGGGFGTNKAEEETLNTLLTEMDGFWTGQRETVIVIAATNLPEELDPALLRRFDKVIEVELPDKEARSAYMKRELADYLKNDKTLKNEIEFIATQTAGCTISDLECGIHETIMAASSASEINSQLLQDTFKFSPHSDKNILQRIAWHEAGHALVSMYYDIIPLYVTIIKRKGSSGSVWFETDEYKDNYTKDELFQQITIAMGGRAAEIHQFGIEQVSTGAADDLRKAIDIATDMICVHGMGDDGIEAIPIKKEGSNEWDPDEKQKAAIYSIMRNANTLSEKILSENPDILSDLVLELMDKNRLNKSDLEKFRQNIREKGKNPKLFPE